MLDLLKLLKDYTMVKSGVIVPQKVKNTVAVRTTEPQYKHGDFSRN